MRKFLTPVFVLAIILPNFSSAAYQPYFVGGIVGGIVEGFLLAQQRPRQQPRQQPQQQPNQPGWIGKIDKSLPQIADIRTNYPSVTVYYPKSFEKDLKTRSHIENFFANIPGFLWADANITFKLDEKLVNNNERVGFKIVTQEGQSTEFVIKRDHLYVVVCTACFYDTYTKKGYFLATKSGSAIVVLEQPKGLLEQKVHGHPFTLGKVLLGQEGGGGGGGGGPGSGPGSGTDVGPGGGGGPGTGPGLSGDLTGSGGGPKIGSAFGPGGPLGGLADAEKVLEEGEGMPKSSRGTEDLKGELDKKPPKVPKSTTDVEEERKKIEEIIKKAEKKLPKPKKEEIKTDDIIMEPEIVLPADTPDWVNDVLFDPTGKIDINRAVEFIIRHQRRTEHLKPEEFKDCTLCRVVTALMKKNDIRKKVESEQKKYERKKTTR